MAIDKQKTCCIISMWNQENLWITYFTVCSTNTVPNQKWSFYVLKIMFQKCNFCSSKLAIILFLTILYWNHCSWYWLRHSVYKTRICLKVEWMKSQTFNFKAEPDHLSFWVHSSLMYSKFFTCLEATLIHTENSFGWCYHYRPGHLNLHCL